MRLFAFFAILGLVLVACSPQGEQDGDTSSSAQPLTQAPPSPPRAGDPVPNPQALLRPGDLGGGEYLLSNGRRITPAGTYVETASFPIDVAVSPDGETAVVVTAKTAGLHLIHLDTASITQTINLSHGYSGIVFNAAGDRFWIAGGASHLVLEYSLSGGVAAEQARIPVNNMPSGMALSPDESKLYVACYLGKRVAVVDTATGEEIDSYAAHLFTYDVKLSPDGTRAYAANHGPGTVSVLDLTDDGDEIEEITVGANPEMMALSTDGSRLYVANSDSDDISVIDTSSLAVIDAYELNASPMEPKGASPTAVEVSADGTRLYVTSSTYNSIDVLDAADGTMLGRIPTGWYPTNAFLDEANGRLVVANGKGRGSAGLSLWSGWQGGLSIIDLPDDGELAAYTEQVEDNIAWALGFFDLTGVSSPIPTVRGVASEQIKHVVYVLRENKTFDQVLADFDGVEGDTGLQNFHEDVIPNAYKLGRSYVLLDNTYTEGDTSVLGHLWATYNNVNDHAEKAYNAGGIYPLPDVDPNTRPQGKTIFEVLLDAGIPFRSYGQVVGLAHDLERFGPYMDFKYGFWNMGVSDEVKVDEIIREVDAGIFEPFTYISLPNDHTYGSSSGAPTPRYLMGDNDAALGKLVEYYSSRPEWESTIIFVIEDDPQSGTDHIDPHRTPAFVIGPYAKRGYISKVMYSMPSVWATIGMILGVPPMNQYDLYASPMYDAFTMTPDSSPYEALANPIELEFNSSPLPLQEYCDNADFNSPDAVSRLGEVLWALTRPGEPWPHHHALSPDLREDEAEEEEEVAEYHAMVERATAYAAARGIAVPQPPKNRSVFVRPAR
ncbi:MAG: bifunctional YncE family protein/alkaline phosphatase family protein [Deltaproteobacteria bacterium]|nr:bifunctional YncE family protein/alkaline phosphatase family protein [Deltaproteobacteria bacterium]